MQPEPDVSKVTHLRPSVAAILTNGDGTCSSAAPIGQRTVGAPWGLCRDRGIGLRRHCPRGPGGNRTHGGGRAPGGRLLGAGPPGRPIRGRERGTLHQHALRVSNPGRKVSRPATKASICSSSTRPACPRTCWTCIGFGCKTPWQTTARPSSARADLLPRGRSSHSQRTGDRRLLILTDLLSYGISLACLS